MIPAKLRAVLDDAEVTFSDCVAAFATDPAHPAIAAAREQGVDDMSDPPIVSEGNDPNGDFILAWVWVPYKKQHQPELPFVPR